MFVDISTCFITKIFPVQCQITVIIAWDLAFHRSFSFFFLSKKPYEQCSNLLVKDQITCQDMDMEVMSDSHSKAFIKSNLSTLLKQYQSVNLQMSFWKYQGSFII